jgi:anti-anti-sigma factor
VHIEERAIGAVGILDLHGKMAAGDDSLRTAIQTLMDRGVRHVVLNFRDVSFMDSVGLSILVRSHLALRQNGGRLVLLHLPRHIADLLTITRLTDVLGAFDDEATAVRDVTRPHQ